MKLVQEYIRDTAHLPWVWGASDCMIWTAGLIYEATGQDIASDLRETYTTAGQAAALVKKLGGPVVLATDRLDGILRTNRAAKWGVGIVHHRPFGRAACVIADGRAMVKTDGGVAVSPDRIICGWSF